MFHIRPLYNYSLAAIKLFLIIADTFYYYYSNFPIATGWNVLPRNRRKSKNLSCSQERQTSDASDLIKILIKLVGIYHKIPEINSIEWSRMKEKSLQVVLFISSKDVTVAKISSWWSMYLTHALSTDMLDIIAPKTFGKFNSVD